MTKPHRLGTRPRDRLSAAAWQRWHQACQLQANRLLPPDSRLFALSDQEKGGTVPAGEELEAGGAPLSQWLALAAIRWSQIAPHDSQVLIEWLLGSTPSEAHDFWKLLADGLGIVKGAHSGWISEHRPLHNSLRDAWLSSKPRLALLEWWSQQFQAEQRRQFGVYHTPPRLARQVWQMLPEEPVSWRSGGWLLDPAAGTQVFACQALDILSQRRDSSDGREGQAQAGREFLSRLVTFELSPAAWLVGFLELADALWRAGDDLRRPLPLRCWLTDALTPADSQEFLGSSLLVEDKRRQSYAWVIGNPPYSSRVEQQHEWTRALLKGEAAGPGGDVSYYHCQGQPLGERKNWLHDLYVSFFRQSQWWTHETPNAGIAFVTNRGFIENKTFRGMREALSCGFEQIELRELQAESSSASTKPAPVEPAGGWFEITTETCLIVLHRRCTASSGLGQVWWRPPLVASPEKTSLSQRGGDASAVPWTPQPPHFEFHPRAAEHRAEFSRGWSLTQIFNTAGSAVVTARDALVVAPSHQELLERLQELADLRVSDETIRAKYFKRSRSRRFLPGDTRGWNLASVRQQLGELSRVDRDSLETLIRPVLYRAFDVRYIAWSKELIDWPRWQTMVTLQEGDGWALVARRQSPVDQPANFFTATRNLVVDGVLRSDNRGNESVFPWQRIDAQGNRVSNLRTEFCHALGNTAPAASESRRRANEGRDTTEAELQVLGYVFAWLHSSEYQQRYRQQLVRQYPRIPLAQDRSFVSQLSQWGRELMDLHGGDSSADQPRQQDQIDAPIVAGDAPRNPVPPGYPQYAEGQVLVDPQWPPKAVSTAVWEYRCGAHQVAKKWLRDRRGRPLTGADLQQYESVLRRIKRVLRLQDLIDQWIAERGGCQQLFSSSLPAPTDRHG